VSKHVYLSHFSMLNNLWKGSAKNVDVSVSGLAAYLKIQRSFTALQTKLTDRNETDIYVV